MGAPPIVDLHEDIPLYFEKLGAGQPWGPFDADLPGREADLPKYRLANVRLVFASSFPGHDVYDPAREREGVAKYGVPLTRAQLGCLCDVLRQIKSTLRLARAWGVRVVSRFSEAAELLSAGEHRLGFLLHLEGADALGDAGDLELLWALGVRSVGLTWNYPNKFAASCYAKRDYGLTDEGEELVREAQRLGMVVDLAHSSKLAALEAISIAKKPVVVSHANARSVHQHPRNVDDEVLDALRKAGGVVGLTLVGSFVSQSPSAEAFFKHLEYVVDNFGVGVAAIGTDFHGLLGLPRVRGLEDVGKLGWLAGALEERGFSKQEVEAILYKNALRVLEANLPP